MLVTRFVCAPSAALLAIILAAALALAACAERPADVHTGPWRAWLDSPGGELPFGLELERGADSFTAFVVNGEERIPISRTERTGRGIAFFFDPYDSSIRATLTADGRRLDGDWRKTTGPGTEARLPFHAVAGRQPRFPLPPTGLDEQRLARLDGRWAVDFAEDDEPAVGIFRVGSDGGCLGTFMTTTGDYRYLAGSFDGDRLRLSCFDGAHAFLFDSRLAADGTLAGEFWSRDSWHESWTARRDPEAALPDAFELTSWIEGRDLGQIVFPDLEGRQRSLADPKFTGRARILEIFGSWCPNCNDATRFLVELDRRYRSRGLSIVGLAFELTGDFERDAEQVRRYAEHHGIEFPLLVAGMSDKQQASERFPLIDRVRSYPTTIFLDGEGRVRAVHQGFTGPATGASYDELRRKFESLIEELIE